MNASVPSPDSRLVRLSILSHRFRLEEVADAVERAWALFQFSLIDSELYEAVPSVQPRLSILSHRFEAFKVAEQVLGKGTFNSLS